MVNDEIIPGNPITAIQELFDKNDVKYWFDKDGIFSGEEFVKEISTAIVNSKMLVFISSKNSNESEYTCGEILKAKKAKKLIIPFLIDECEYNEKFEILLLPLNHIDYVNQPNTALPELLRTVKKEKERIRLLEHKQNEILLKEKKKQEITAGIKEFQRLNGEQDFLLKSLYSKSKDVGAGTKRCPVCDAQFSVDVPYCEFCGWSFASLYGVFGVDGNYLHDEKQLRIVRGLWQDLKDGKDNKARLEEIAAILEDERQKKVMYAEQSNMLKETAHSLEQEKQAQQERIRVMESELHKKADELKSTQNELKSTQNELESIQNELEKRTKLFKQQYEEQKQRMEESERKLAEERRKAEERRLAEERKAQAERKRREEEERAEEKTFTVEGVSFKMIRVEGGSMGTFYIGESQVTQALWEVVMGNNPSHFKGENHPVECISWNDICGWDGSGTDHNCFLFKLNQKTGMKYRLPKEAEWEFAARGGNGSKGYKYSGSNTLGNVAWYVGNSGDETHDVKTKSPNELGIYDMSGNVWEWCQDLYNPKGSYRVFRGGSWYNNAANCRVTSRYFDSPTSTISSLGFRLAL